MKNITQLFIVVIYSLKQFYKDGCLYKASALAYTTLLSMVPLIAVSFSVVSSFPVSKQFADIVRTFAFEYFVADKSKVIENYLLQFANQVNQLSAIGLLFLIITAILTLYTIEQTLNDIWKVKIKRHSFSAFLMYWAVLTLIPILIGLSVAISSYFMSLPFFQNKIFDYVWIQKWYVLWLPLFFGFVIFFVLYVVVPSVKVKLIHGGIGALVATLLFSVTKWGFALYIKQFHTYELLYGAFASIPIFLMWLFLVWAIVLFGAEITHACSIGKKNLFSPILDPFSQSFLWLYKLWENQKVGNLITLQQLIDESQFGCTLTPIELLNVLLEAKIIKITDHGRLILSINLSDYTLFALYQKLPWKLPSINDIPDYVFLIKFKNLLVKTENDFNSSLNVKLSQLF